MSISLNEAIASVVRAEVAAALAPHTAALERLHKYLGGGAPARRGRPPGSGSAAGQSCAVIDCGRPNKSKGYCASHYQKLRNLVKTKRRPADWKDNAAPNTVKDIVLPRGRAAAKLLAKQRRK